MINLKNYYKHFNQLFKYAIVGVSGTAIDFIVLYLLVEYVHLNLFVSATISFILAASNNFILNKLWTFASRSKNYKKLYIKYLIVAVVGLLITVSLMYILTNLLGLWYMLSKVLATLVVLIWNFLGNKFWTFKINPKKIEIPSSFEYKLSVVIPAYNEEKRIKTTLVKIYDYLSRKKIDAEIIVVDDGSTDKTVALLEKYKSSILNLKIISYKKNQGKGYALKKGILEAKGELILFTDADNSTPIEDFSKLKTALEKTNYEIAIGSRYLNKSSVKIKQPFYRILFGRLGNGLIQAFLIDGIKDTQCGFKLFKHTVAKEIFTLQKVKRWGFNMEVLSIAKSLNYKIVEVPVNWFNSTDSRLRPFLDFPRTFKELIYIKINHWCGRYSSEDLIISSDEDTPS